MAPYVAKPRAERPPTPKAERPKTYAMLKKLRAELTAKFRLCRAKIPGRGAQNPFR